LGAKSSILNAGNKIAIGETAACLLLYTTNKKSWNATQEALAGFYCFII